MTDTTMTLIALLEKTGEDYGPIRRLEIVGVQAVRRH